ncbi:hypothetical protein ACFL6L_01780 [candidate division KSB1 bacterium]
MSSIVIRKTCIYGCVLAVCCGFTAESACVQEVLSNVLTLELTIGGESYFGRDEFIPVSPGAIAVNDNGDILVYDEDKIKVFSADGDEKYIFGGTGQGPGEFERPRFPAMSIGEGGYLAVLKNETCHFFSPDYEFSSRVRISSEKRYRELRLKENFPMHRIEEVCFHGIDSESFVFMFQGQANSDAQKFDLFMYCSLDTLAVLNKWPRTSYIRGTSLDSPVLGRLLSAALPGRSVVYTHAGHNYRIEDDRADYTLRLIDLDTFSERLLVHSYEPVQIPDEVIDEFRGGLWRGKSGEIVRNAYERKKFYSPVKNLKTDGNVIFAFTYETKNNEEIRAELFDAETRTYLRSVWFPDWLANQPMSRNQSIFRDGYVYRISSGSREFATIRKYKVNPRVYAR